MKEGKLVMQARILVYRPNGAVEDWTHREHFGLKSMMMSTDAPHALMALKNCENRLRLLGVAAAGRKHLEAKLVGTAVDDLLMDIEGILGDFIRHSADLFKNTEALPPLVTQPGEPSLQIVQKKPKPQAVPHENLVS